MPAALCEDDQLGTISLTTILVTVNGYTVTASGKSGSATTTYTEVIKNSSGVTVYNSNQIVAPGTKFNFTTTLPAAGTYSLTVTGTDGTNFETSITVPVD